MNNPARNKPAGSIVPGFLVFSVGLLLSSCTGIPSAGPSTRTIAAAKNDTSANAGVKIIELTDAVAKRVASTGQTAWFADAIGNGYPIGSIVGKGDVLDIAIWEAPPAALFGTAGGDARLTSSGLTARATTLPEQMVDSDGSIAIPFAGRVQAAGRTPQQIARDIKQLLTGKAHQPQIIVRLVRNATATVTVVGDVTNSGHIQLTARGEKLLDVLASVGGVRQPVGKMTIQITRGDRVAAMPLETIILNPKQNIRLQPDDVVTALYQPYSFVALGATGRNEEVLFEGTGITLAQALGRVAGLQDQRADIRGVFIFRMEDVAAIDPEVRNDARATSDGKVPVIYRINMKEAATFFIAQSFPIRDQDVLYVSNAPLADLQKFVNVISSTILPAATAAAIVP